MLCRLSRLRRLFARSRGLGDRSTVELDTGKRLVVNGGPHQKPRPFDGHSLQRHGSQFTSWAFSQNVRRYGLLGSMGTIGDCYDNAPMESFWGSMQIELLNRQRWITNVQLSVAIADFIENFYNPQRRHSSLNYLTPNEFENLHLTQTQTTFS